MITLDVSPAFSNGNQGLTIYRSTEGFVVSVKTANDGFIMGHGADPKAALNKAVGGTDAKPAEEDILGDLM